MITAFGSRGRTGLTTAERDELARLRKENRELRTERDILQALGVGHAHPAELEERCGLESDLKTDGADFRSLPIADSLSITLWGDQFGSTVRNARRLNSDKSRRSLRHATTMLSSARTRYQSP